MIDVDREICGMCVDYDVDSADVIDAMMCTLALHW